MNQLTRLQFWVATTWLVFMLIMFATERTF